jgi:hypothetical protein
LTLAQQQELLQALLQDQHAQQQALLQVLMQHQDQHIQQLTLPQQMQ